MVIKLIFSHIHSMTKHTNTHILVCTHFGLNFFVDFSTKLNPNDNHLNNFISIKQDYRFFSSFSFLYRCKKTKKEEEVEKKQFLIDLIIDLIFSKVIQFKHSNSFSLFSLFRAWLMRFSSNNNNGQLPTNQPTNRPTINQQPKEMIVVIIIIHDCRFKSTKLSLTHLYSQC